MFFTQFQPSESPLKLQLVGTDCPPVELRRSRRAQRFSLKVSHTERAAILTLPQEVKMQEAGNFLLRHMDWLKRQMERLPQPVPFADGAVIPLRGVSYRISYAGALRYQGVVWVEEADAITAENQYDSSEICKQNSNVLEVSKADTRVLPRICVSGSEKHGSRRLADWLRAQAKSDLTRRTLYHAANLGCNPKRISVRDQSTRWGSCSSTGTISYSWRLIFAPDFVLDYVAAHEVAHLREMNHGPRFWRLVRETMPDMHKARAWLKQNGAELHKFGASS
jgi:predicted metal-dependent hydrolase